MSVFVAVFALVAAAIGGVFYAKKQLQSRRRASVDHSVDVIVTPL